MRNEKVFFTHSILLALNTMNSQINFFFYPLPLQVTNYKYNHLGNLQYLTATNVIYSTTTVTYTTYNTIQY